MEHTFHRDDDWRAFRAKLIAQEHLQDKTTSKSSNPTTIEQVVGSLFFKALDSIHLMDAAPAYKSSKDAKQTKAPLFYDDFHLNPPAEELLEDDNPSQSTLFILPSSSSPVNASWAHPISHLEPGCVLISNENIGGIYHQSVILLIEHSSQGSSTGLMLNRGDASPTSTMTDNDGRRRPTYDVPTFSGGPLFQQEFILLHDIPNLPGSTQVAPGVFCGGQLDDNDHSYDPSSSRLRIFQGRAQWSPKQLEQEVRKQKWYVAATSRDFIFHDDRQRNRSSTSVWSDILKHMGGKYAETAKKHANTK